MKRLATLAAVALAFVLSACASSSTVNSSTTSLATQVQKACAIVQPVIVSLQAQFAVLTADQLSDLDTAATLAAKVCSAAAVTPPASVADFVTAAFPMVIRIVNASPMLPTDKAAAAAALTVAQIALSTALAQ